MSVKFWEKVWNENFLSNLFFFFFKLDKSNTQALTNRQKLRHLQMAFTDIPNKENIRQLNPMNRDNWDKIMHDWRSFDKETGGH